MNTSDKLGVRLLEITPDQAGQRIDNFLLGRLKGVPKSHIYRLLRSGQVRVNKGRIKQTYRLQAGDLVRVPPVREAAREAPPSPSARLLATLEASILYQDAGLLILDKPAGLAVHGGSGISLGLIEGLRALYPKAPFLELVHRLDRDTSGCLMVAKKPAVLRELHELLRGRGVRKHYLALAQGQWPKDLREIDLPLRKNTLRSGERVVRVDPEGKPAVSRFRVLETLPGASLVEIELLTGRTHQIRVHAAHAGHPLAGDDKYGERDFNYRLKVRGLQRLFLHARRLDIRRAEAPPVRVEAPLPEDLQQLLEQLKNHAL